MRIKKFLFALSFLLLFVLAGCSSAAEPPAATVKISDALVKIKKGTYEWETKSLFSSSVIHADAAAPFQIAEEMEAFKVPQNANGNIEFSDQSEPELAVFLWQGEERGKELTLKQNQFTFPSQGGRQIIEVFARWPNGYASYTFVVEVQ